jgi:hypothetical protein
MGKINVSDGCLWQGFNWRGDEAGNNVAGNPLALACREGAPGGDSL